MFLSPHQTLSVRRALLLLLVPFCLLLLVGPAAAAPTTRHVAKTGLDSGDCSLPQAPCLTIGYALGQAAGGDTVKVAQGVYEENLAVLDNINLFGGYDPADWQTRPSPFGSTIDGRHLDATVTYADGFAGTVDGFKITGGKADRGGGVRSALGSVTLQNLWITDNEANEMGGGVYLEQGQPQIIGCKIEKNQAMLDGGGVYIANAAATLLQVEIVNNGAQNGGGIGLSQTGQVLLKESRLIANLGTSQSGGIDMVDADLTIEQSVLAGNSGGDHGGAMTLRGSQLEIINGLLYGNGTTTGNANVIAMEDSEAFLVNTTIVGNRPDGAQAVLLWGATGTFVLKNGIMWNNALNLQGDPPCPSCFVISYSDVQGYSGGANNIDQDPLFVNPLANDYRLQAGSPCIDQGNISGAPPADLAGTPRDSMPDMGAFEYAAPVLSEKVYLPVVMRG